MTNNVNGIGINTGSVNPYGNQPKGNNPKPEEKKPDTPKTGAPTVNANPDDIYAAMAQQALLSGVKVTTPKTYDVGKYVTPEQAERIAGFIGSFEGDVAKYLSQLEAEFGDNLSEEAKLEIAAGMVK